MKRRSFLILLVSLVVLGMGITQTGFTPVS